MFERKIGNNSKASLNAAGKLRATVAYESAGKYESALMSLEEALALQENYPDAWLIKGVILGKSGRCSEALKCYDRVSEIDPQSADAWHLKAATFTSLNLHDKAVESYAKAVELAPANLEFRLSLAVALQKLKRFEEALKCYEEMKRQKPTDPRFDYFIGAIWGNMGDYRKAFVSFEQALWLKPNFTDALLGKGIMLTKLGRNEEAKECANKLLETKGTSEKQQAIQAQSLNESIRGEFNAAQNKFRTKYSSNPS